jgi:hypothetical protein
MKITKKNIIITFTIIGILILFLTVQIFLITKGDQSENTKKSNIISASSLIDTPSIPKANNDSKNKPSTINKVTVKENYNFTFSWSRIMPIAAGTGNIKSLYAAQDNSNLYILVKGTSIKKESNSFFIDVDNNTATGFHYWVWGKTGIEFLIVDRRLYKYNGTGYNWSWNFIGEVTLFRTNNSVEVLIELSQLGKSVRGPMSIAYEDQDNNMAPDKESVMALADKYLNSIFPRLELIPQKKVKNGSKINWRHVKPLISESGQALYAIQDNYKLYILAKGPKIKKEYNSFFIDTDNNSRTGFHHWIWANTGIEYLIVDKRIYKYTGSGYDWAWRYTGAAKLSFAINSVQISVNLNQLGKSRHKSIRISYVDVKEDKFPFEDNSMSILTKYIK